MGAPGTPGVELRVQKALELVESAQRDLSRAQAELSPIAGAASMWYRAGRLSETCRSFWYALSKKNRGTWRLDVEPGEGDPS